MITKTEKGFLKASVIENNIISIWSIKTIQDLFTGKEALEHIFVGYTVENKFSGYHTECMYPNKYHQDSSDKNNKLDKSKVYKLYLPDEEKYSTCFPNDMDAIDIILAIDEANENVIKKRANNEKTNTGYSETYKVKIKILKDQNGKVYNAFPLQNNFSIAK